jgi:glycosyltransferase involved in cell wall biosynthesis
VVIAIATYRRPAMLNDLLASLAAAVPRRAPARVSAVVVDNDAEGSARAMVEAWRARLPFPIAYEVEPERNISLARNRGVRRALAEGADFVAFVDDDEAVSPEWLDELLLAQRRTGADVVTGPVHPRYPPSAPRWLVKGGFFEPLAAADGEAVTVASTNNVLVRVGLLADPRGAFHPGFGISGGGDSLFFARAHRGGARLVWAARAGVTETIPATRARAVWILRRAFRVGNGAVWAERAMEPPLRRMGERTVKGTARLLLGVAALPVSLLRGRSGAVSALWDACYGAGCLAALAGYRYVEYREVHGG